ncbi:hypothetical protein ANO11243_056370 [Dothideomycetidae sp. 11243]|nr:hypothetical protein ANO11243_056370 [fungal sp. No.11243]
MDEVLCISSEQWQNAQPNQRSEQHSSELNLLQRQFERSLSKLKELEKQNVSERTALQALILKSTSAEAVR